MGTASGEGYCRHFQSILMNDGIREKIYGENAIRLLKGLNA